MYSKTPHRRLETKKIQKETTQSFESGEEGPRPGGRAALRVTIVTKRFQRVVREAQERDLEISPLA